MNKALQILIDRGFVNNCTDFEGLSALMDKESISFYCGVDPTGPSLHVGHIVPFFAMHHLQLFSHKPVALVGNGTALIGDPSGKTEMRKMLSVDDIEENGKRIEKQLSSVVDFSEKVEKGKGRATVMYNGEWLKNLNYIEFLRDIGKYFSVNRMLTFEGVKQRLERGLSFIEFNYQLLQAYDFKMLHDKIGLRLQIGGADQWGNIVAGIDLIERTGGKQCYGLTFNLITRSDGKKMGKSEKGAVFLSPSLYSPYDFYQYWRNVSDEDTIRFMKLFTFLTLEEIESYKEKNVNEAKERLAYEVTNIIHGKEEAEKAISASRSLFAGGENSENVPSFEIDKENLIDLGILDLYTKSSLTASNAEARRLIEQGGAEINGEKIKDTRYVIKESDIKDDGTIMLKSGKKKFMRIKVI